MAIAAPSSAFAVAGYCRAALSSHRPSSTSTTRSPRWPRALAAGAALVPPSSAGTTPPRITIQSRQCRRTPASAQCGLSQSNGGDAGGGAMGGSGTVAGGCTASSTEGWTGWASLAAMLIVSATESNGGDATTASSTCAATGPSGSGNTGGSGWGTDASSSAGGWTVSGAATGSGGGPTGGRPGEGFGGGNDRSGYRLRWRRVCSGLGCRSDARARLAQSLGINLQPNGNRGALLKVPARLERGDAAAYAPGGDRPGDGRDERDRQEDEADNYELQTGSSYASFGLHWSVPAAGLHRPHRPR